MHSHRMNNQFGNFQLMSQDEGNENAINRNKRNSFKHDNDGSKQPRITSRENECGEIVPMELHKIPTNQALEQEVLLSNTITNQPILILQSVDPAVKTQSIRRIESDIEQDREEQNQLMKFQRALIAKAEDCKRSRMQKQRLQRKQRLQKKQRLLKKQIAKEADAIAKEKQDIRKKEERVEKEKERIENEMSNVLKKDYSEWTSAEKNQFVNHKQLREEISKKEEDLRKKEERLEREEERIERDKERIENEKQDIRKKEERIEKEMERIEEISAIKPHRFLRSVDVELKKDLSIKFNRLPAIDEIEGFMQTKLLRRIPIQCDESKLDAILPNDELIFDLEHHSQLGSQVVVATLNPFCPGSSENVNIYQIDLLVRGILDFFLDIVFLNIGRNQMDTSTTKANLRPDFLCWVKNVLLFRGEEKGNSTSFHLAVNELKNKLDVWDRRLFGDISYVVGYACAGAQFQFFAIQQALIRPISPLYNLSSSSHRFAIIRSTINLVRLFVTMYDFLPSVVPPPIGGCETSSNGERRIDYFSKFVFKTCRLSIDKRLLKDIYAQTANVPNLIHLLNWSDKGDSYVRLQLSPLGFRQEPETLIELRNAIYCVLVALQGLHEKGYVHRGIRWPNILVTVDNSWVLIDLESAGKIGFPTTWYRSDHPPEASKKWVGKSDIYSVGRLFDGYRDRRNFKDLLTNSFQTMAFQRFIDKLCKEEIRNRYSAMEALKDVWFKEDQCQTNKI